MASSASSALQELDPVAAPLPPAGEGRTPPPKVLTLAAALVGLGFAAPFAYLGFRTATAPGGPLEILAEAGWLAPLLRSPLLSVSVAAGSAPHPPRRTSRPGGSGWSCCRSRWSSRRSWRPSP